jgi:hypothetical protein
MPWHSPEDMHRQYQLESIRASKYSVLRLKIYLLLPSWDYCPGTGQPPIGWEYTFVDISVREITLMTAGEATGLVPDCQCLNFIVP